MRYFHLLYLVVTAILAAPFFVLGWMYEEAAIAFRMGRNGCYKYGLIVDKAVREITGV